MILAFPPGGPFQGSAARSADDQLHYAEVAVTRALRCSHIGVLAAGSHTRRHSAGAGRAAKGVGALYAPAIMKLTADAVPFVAANLMIAGW